jgi:hypothetical protein
LIFYFPYNSKFDLCNFQFTPKVDKRRRKKPVTGKKNHASAATQNQRPCNGNGAKARAGRRKDTTPHRLQPALCCVAFLRWLKPTAMKQNWAKARAERCCLSPLVKTNGNKAELG